MRPQNFVLSATLFVLSASALAEDPSTTPSSKPLVPLGQACDSATADCVSVGRDDEAVLVMRGSEIVATVPIKAPPGPESVPAVKVTTSKPDQIGCVSATITRSGSSFGPFQLPQGEKVAVSRDGAHFALLQHGRQWSLVIDGTAFPLENVSHAAGARFSDDAMSVFIDVVEGQNIRTIEVRLAGSEP